MRLKYLIFSSTMLLFSIIIAGNAWHLAKLTDVTSGKLGEAAFNVSKSTVESVLSQRLNTGMIFIEQQVSEINRVTRENNTNPDPTNSNPTGNTNSRQRTSTVHLKPRDFNFEQSIDLKLNDSAESRSIQMIANNTVYDIPIPRTEIENSIAQASNAIIFTSIASFLFALLFAFYVSDRITRPLGNICRVSNKVGSGDFSEKVPALSRFSSIEMKALVNSINKMSTQLQILEKEKADLQEQKTTNEISEISRGLAHSIRNPLHTIQLSVEARSDDETLIQQIKKQVHRIDHHIRELMTITTHDALSPDTGDLVELIDEVVADSRLRFPVTMSCKLEASASRKIKMVESELRSCVTTLINNAIDACDNESDCDINVEVSQTNNQSHDEWKVKVNDTGKGVSDDIRAMLFSPHNTNKSYGAGMGLYIAQRIIVGRYSGSIDYQANKPCGSIFTITLTHRHK